MLVEAKSEKIFKIKKKFQNYNYQKNLQNYNEQTKILKSKNCQNWIN